MTALLEVEDLTVRFDRASERAAVQDVGLRLREGESLGIVGESGSGKTTTIRAVLRLLPPTAEVHGRALLAGQDLLSMPPQQLKRLRWRELALVPQSAMNSLDPVRTVESQFVEVIRLHRDCNRREATTLARQALAEVGIDPGRATSYPHQFSGGMRQRALIALATVLRPRLLIADEPTTGLDVIVQDQVLRTLEVVQQRQGLALILVTHDLGVVSEMCDRIMVMQGGRIVECGTTQQIILAPRHPYTAALIAAADQQLVEQATERAGTAATHGRAE